MQPTWILVADAVRARLFSPNAAGNALTEIEDFTNPQGRNPGHDAGHDRPPRVMESMGHMSHAIAPHTNPEEKVADRFAHELNGALERGRNDHCYERLVLVAPPRFLGVLQNALDKQVGACVVAHLNKDLTELPASDIFEKVAPHLRA